MRTAGADRRHNLPILILLVANTICGLLVFRHYGLSWDEPLFYDYARALGYAYSPSAWFSGDFNLERAYGASASDHANRGPAYILLARQPAAVLESAGLDTASAWHLVNFLTFQLGVYFLYRLARRFMQMPAALAAAALFAWQPLLWGHAFINPKDPPFLVFFLGAVVLGFEMVDQLARPTDIRPSLPAVLIPAVFLGMATSIRVLGPLAGLLVIVYGLARIRPSALPFASLLVYSITAALTMFITWPYLWPDPVGRFAAVFRFMSENPTQLAVLFNGEIFQAGALPRRYFPMLLGLTLTEPVWFLFAAGLAAGIGKQLSASRDRAAGGRSHLADLWLSLLWFLIPLIYVILRKPPMYDGFRHFLFILPPAFLTAGLGLDWLFQRIRSRPLIALLTGLLVVPGISGIVRLHPFEYTYYNSFTGGTAGAFRTYETDYWLTCYKQAMEDLQEKITGAATVYVHREAYIAAHYAEENVTVLEERGAINQIKSGDYVLVNSRANEDLKTFKAAPIVQETGRDDAVFCVIKRIP